MKNLQAHDFFMFGYFGMFTNQLDGQTVKTRSVHQLFEEKLVDIVPYYDTEELKTNKWSLVQAVLRMVKSKHLMYLPAQNNLQYFFLPLFILSILFRFRIHYFVVGGWLSKFLEDKPGLKRRLKNIANIFVETQLLANELNHLGFKNVTCFPNFRFASPIPFNPTKDDSGVLKLVFFSRINKMKGYDTVFELISSGLLSNCTIDFYGPIHAPDREDFDLKITQHEQTKYLGQIEPENITQVLSKYDLLLFPTRYYTEGLPGSIVDSYFAGLPVIATKWKHADEFVIHGKTGYLVPFENGEEQMADYIKEMDLNRDILYELKKNALNEAQRFTSKRAWAILEPLLN